MSTYAQTATETRASETARAEVGSDGRTALAQRLGSSLNEGPAATSLAQLRSVLDQSPRVQAQRALQSALNRHATPAQPAHESARGVFQRAKLNLRGNGTISGVSDWPSRPSSNVSGKQGQHLTAYVSFTDMILSHVRDRTVAEAANALIDVLDRVAELPKGKTWYHTYGDTIHANKELLREAAADDDAKTVGVVIDRILSLRNKVPDTAIATAEQTWGHGESSTSGSLEVLETDLRKNGGTLPAQYTAQTEADAALFNMWRLLDYQPKTSASDEAFEKTLNRVLTHLLQMRLSYPQVFAWLTARGSRLMTYIKAHRTDPGMPLSNLDDNEIDAITRYVYS